MNETDAAPTIDERLAQIAGVVADQLDADVILYNGPTYPEGVARLIQCTIERSLRNNVMLILVTPGGDAGAAYQIARWLQNSYKRFILYVSGYCKSAGTLIATGAHEVVMSKYGELGPLDVQMSKRDELAESRSGLVVPDTLDTLQQRALETFVATLLETKRGSGGAVSLKMATEIAISMTTGLFSPIYGQLDPLLIGESARAMNISFAYGTRLLRTGGNIGTESLSFITSGYPSHDFVIDRTEAMELFRSVRDPNVSEIILADLLGMKALFPINLNDHDPAIVEVLSTEPTDAHHGNVVGLSVGENHEQAPHGSQHSPEEAAQVAHAQPTGNGISKAEPGETRRRVPGEAG